MKSASEEETSLSSSEEADLIEGNHDEEINGTKKIATDNTVSSWEMRESIEITLTAQPEDTVTTEERLDIPEVLTLFWRICSIDLINSEKTTNYYRMGNQLVERMT